VALAAASLSLDVAPPPFEIAVEDAADPWSRADGSGFANDMVRNAFRASGFDVAFRVVPYARCKNMVLSGAVVACFSMSPEPDLRDRVTFPAVPLFECYTTLVQNPARPLGAARLDALPRGTVIGAVLGYEYPREVDEARRAGRIMIETSPSEETLLRKLAARRIAGALINVNASKPLEFIAARARVANGYEAAGRVGTLSSYLGFSRAHPRGAEAVRAYEEGMRRIASNGAAAGVVRDWTDSSRVTIRAFLDSLRKQPP